VVIADYTGVAAGSLTDLVFVHGRVLLRPEAVLVLVALAAAALEKAAAALAAAAALETWRARRQRQGRQRGRVLRDMCLM
jgi:hypothetical protein